MKKLLFTPLRHNPIIITLSTAIAVLTVTLVLLFAAAPDTDPAYGMDRQELTILRYGQAD